MILWLLDFFFPFRWSFCMSNDFYCWLLSSSKSLSLIFFLLLSSLLELLKSPSCNIILTSELRSFTIFMQIYKVLLETKSQFNVFSWHLIILSEGKRSTMEFHPPSIVISMWLFRRRPASIKMEKEAREDLPRELRGTICHSKENYCNLGNKGEVHEREEKKKKFP